jgi:hypothetical protein
MRDSAGEGGGLRRGLIPLASSIDLFLAFQVDSRNDPGLLSLGISIGGIRVLAGVH